MSKKSSQGSTPFLNVLLTEFAEKVIEAEKQGMDLSVLPIMPIQGCIEDFVKGVMSENFEVDVDAQWFDSCVQIVEAYLNRDRERVFLSSDWYASLTPEKKEVMDYFQVFEYTIANAREEIDLEWYRLDNPELLVGLGMDRIGNGTPVSEMTMVPFRDALRIVAREIPNEWFEIDEDAWNYWDGGNLNRFRLNMRKDIDALLEEMARENLRVIK